MFFFKKKGCINIANNLKIYNAINIRPEKLVFKQEIIYNPENLDSSRNNIIQSTIYTSCIPITFGCLTNFIVEISRLICLTQKEDKVSVSKSETNS